MKFESAGLRKTGIMIKRDTEQKELLEVYKVGNNKGSSRILEKDNRFYTGFSAIKRRSGTKF